MTSEVHRIQIQKLGSTNYKAWAATVQVVLLSRKIWTIVSGDRKRPEKDATEEDKAEALNWMTDDALARSIIMTSVDAQQMTHIVNLQTAKDQWDTLKRVHEARGTHRLAALLRQFYRWELGDRKIDVGVAELNGLQADISAIDSKESPTEFAKTITLLSGLPEQYKTLTQILEGVKDLGFEDAIGRLKQEEFSQQDTGTALHARFGRGRGKQEPTCFYCKQKGHIKHACQAWLQTPHGKDWARNNPRDPKDGRGKGQGHGQGPRDNGPKGKQQAAVAEAADTQVSGQQEGAWMALAGSGHGQADWVVDSGATNHMTDNRSIFTSFRPVNGPSITTAGKGSLQTTARGDVSIVAANGVQVTIKDVMYVPGLGHNLLSLAQLEDRGISYRSEKGRMEFVRQGKVIGHATRRGRTYILSGVKEKGLGQGAALIAAQGAAPEGPAIAAPAITEEPFDLWHRRFGHLGQGKLRQLHGVTQGLKGPIGRITSTSPCEPCIYAKKAQVINKITPERTTRPLELVHTDFCGPIPVLAVGPDHIQGAIYLLTFTDDYSRKTWVYPTKRRDHLYRIFDAWKAYVELTYQAKVKALRADNALEYKSLATRLRPSGVAVEFTVDYTPWQNGVAERMNRTIFSLVRSLLFESSLPDSF